MSRWKIQQCSCQRMRLRAKSGEAGSETKGSLSPVESDDPEAAGARGDSESRVVSREHQVGRGRFAPEHGGGEMNRVEGTDGDRQVKRGAGQDGPGRLHDF